MVRRYRNPAALMGSWLPAARFDELVADALDLIPSTLAGAMDNVVVTEAMVNDVC